MESNEIEIGTRKLQKVGGAVQMTIPSTVVKVLQLKLGIMLKCWLDGDTIILRKE